jgi:hypothetical protein
VVVRYRKTVPGAFVFDNVDPAENGAQGDANGRAGLLFDDDGVYPQGFGVEGVLKLEGEDVAVGEKGKADAVTKGGMPGDRAAVGRVAGDGKAPLRGNIYGYGGNVQGRF